MDNTGFYEYIRQTGLETRELVTALFGILFLLFTGWAYRGLASDWAEKRLRYNDIFGPLGGALIGVFCFLMVYLGMRDRYLLREGIPRYTLARVTGHGTRRGYRQFVYHYEVAGQDYQGAEDCGVSYNRPLPCPARGTRFYVRFSPEDPSVERITQLEVPDSVRAVPPGGWARLP